VPGACAAEPPSGETQERGQRFLRSRPRGVRTAPGTLLDGALPRRDRPDRTAPRRLRPPDRGRASSGRARSLRFDEPRGGGAPLHEPEDSRGEPRTLHIGSSASIRAPSSAHVSEPAGRPNVGKRPIPPVLPRPSVALYVRPMEELPGRVLLAGVSAGSILVPVDETVF